MENHKEICDALRLYGSVHVTDMGYVMKQAADIIEKQDAAIANVKETVFKSCVELLKSIAESALPDYE